MVRKVKVYSIVAGVLCAAVVTGCGGGGGGATVSAGASNSLSGLAATGAGIANGVVTARCASGPVLNGVTDAGGVFTLDLGARTAPCMVQVTGGTPSVTLYSFAQSAGRVNITPATDLIVARALGADPDAQFAAFDAAKGITINTNLAAAKTYVNTQLSAIAGAPLVLDPMTGVFLVGDADDKVLDALGAAMGAANKTVADLRPDAVANANLVTAVPAFLGAPGSPTAIANSASQITVAWTAVPGATSYKVYRAGTTGAVDVSGSAVGTPSTNTFVDTGLAATTAYFYKVVAFNAVLPAGGGASAEASATTSAGGGGGGQTCDTSLFQSGALVRTPTSGELATFARTYSGSEGDYGTNPGDPFVASGSATLVFNASGTATYNGTNYAITSYCLETLSGNPSSQLVIHAGAMSHFDLKTTGVWAGYAAGKVVTDAAYSGASSFGSLAITGNAVGVGGATVPTSFTPSLQGSHPTAIVSWSQSVSGTPWYIALNGDVVTSTAGFGSWQKQAVLAGIESLGVSFDMPNGRITLTNVTLPAFSVGQTGSMVLNGTLDVPAATGTAVTISGTGTNAAGTGLDAPAATVATAVIGSTTKNTYTWNGGKGVSVQVENYSNGTKTVTVTNAAGPSWRNLSPASTVIVDSNAKTVSFSNAGLAGISPTTSTVTLNGILTLP